MDFRKFFLVALILLLGVFAWYEGSNVDTNLSHPVSELPVHSYQVGYKTRVILDGLQTSAVPTALSTVRWQGPEGMIIEDPEAVRTYFVSPEEDTVVPFTLSLVTDGIMTPVATFRFRVMSDSALRADANHDGQYDSSDLLSLLQHWDSFGPDAPKMMAMILSPHQ